jgi:hypothetical protein
MILRSPDLGRLAGAVALPGELIGCPGGLIPGLPVAVMLTRWRVARVSDRRAGALTEEAGWRYHEVNFHAVHRRRVTRQDEVGSTRQGARGREQPGLQARLGHLAQAPASALGIRPKEGGECIKARLLFCCASVLAAATSAPALSRPVQGERHSHLLPPNRLASKTRPDRASRYCRVMRRVKTLREGIAFCNSHTDTLSCAYDHVSKA